MFEKSILFVLAIYTIAQRVYNVEKIEGELGVKFLSFEENREKMLGQYVRVFESYDKAYSESLFKEVKAIYDGEKYEVLGKGKALKHFLERVEIFVNPRDIFADLSVNENTPLRIRKEVYATFHKKRGEARLLTNNGAIFANGDYGHTSPDWKRVLTLGITGMIKEAEKYLGEKDITEEQRAFYTSVKYAYEGMLAFTKRLYEAVKADSSENCRFTAENLLALTKGAPANIAEAMQLFFIYYVVQQKHDGAVLRSLGEVDTLLYPYYLKNTETGEFSEEELRELIKYFLFKWYTMKQEANIPLDLSDEPNELTYMMLEEYVNLDIHDPKIHIKCTPKTPDKLISFVMNAVRNGNNSFVFMNHKVIKQSLEKIGVKVDGAEDYTLVGCYEPLVVGKELPCTVNGKINMPMAAELVMKDVRNGKKIESYRDFESCVKEKIKYFIDVSVEEINTIEEKYPKIFQSPILSGSYECCMERGLDIYSGGAIYNNSSISCFGLATLVDGLLAVNKIVYTDKKLTLEELADVLENNWQDREDVRLEIKRSDLKYGNGNKEADELAADIVRFLSDNINGRANGRGGVYRLGLFSIDWIFKYGAAIGASPDGRLAGEPVSKNLSASVGMDKKGVTGLIRSVSKQDHTLAPNGAVLDISLHPTSVSGDEGLEIMKSLLSIYFGGGGFALQMNVVGRETLVAAQKEPEKYKNLQVRLCGWNVYFTELEREVQNQLIESMVNQ